jgi:D-galactarolactone cycloisomerase
MTESFGYDRQGTAMLAVSAIDMALHDAAAHEQGVSIAAMLGGALRKRVLAYTSGLFFKPDGDPYRDFEKDADALLKRNFKAIKPRCGYGIQFGGVRGMRIAGDPTVTVGDMVDFHFPPERVSFFEAEKGARI